MLKPLNCWCFTTKCMEQVATICNNQPQCLMIQTPVILNFELHVINLWRCILIQTRPWTTLAKLKWPCKWPCSLSGSCHLPTSLAPRTWLILLGLEMARPDSSPLRFSKLACPKPEHLRTLLSRTAFTSPLRLLFVLFEAWTSQGFVWPGPWAGPVAHVIFFSGTSAVEAVEVG